MIIYFGDKIILFTWAECRWTDIHQKKKKERKRKRKEYNKQIDKRKKRSPRGINLIITV